MGEIMIFPKDLFFCQKIIKNFIYVRKKVSIIFAAEAGVHKP